MTYTTQPIRTLTTKKGVSITTPLSDREAIMLLAQDSSDFAQKLYSDYLQKGLSEDQITWAHKLVVDKAREDFNKSQIKLEISKPKIKAKIENYLTIVGMFSKAKENLKFPKFKIRLDNDQVVQLKMSGASSKYQGQIQITDGGKFGDNQWYGRITTEGRFYSSNISPDWVIYALNEFASDPQGIAAKYGKLTGNCCFCYKELTDNRSLSVGYGATCADHYGLPWG